MKKINLYLMIMATFLATSACSEDDAAPAPSSVGLSFATDAGTIDRNTGENVITVVVNVDAPLTEAELQNRLKLKLTSATAEAGKDYKVKSSTITGNPLKATLEIEALPSLAQQPQQIVISFDDSMQPITLGTNPTYTLTILPYSPAKTWANPTSPFYAPKVHHIMADGTIQSTNVGHFSVLDPTDASVLGFVNNNVVASGVNLFNMVRIYGDQIGSTNIKTAKINSPKTLKFTPTSPGAKSGTVSVIPQEVVVTRIDASTFKIGISGQGTYDEESGEINLVVDFNEMAIGGPAKVSRTYKINK